MSPAKIVFVTIGATAAFDALIQAILQPTFLRALKATAYTKLIVQYGRGGKELFEKLVHEAEEQGPYGLTVEGFEFTQDMTREMRAAKAENGREEGVVLCHAGL
jgi:beta-1,4-N-acetylglucosaminyltransferase